MTEKSSENKRWISDRVKGWLGIALILLSLPNIPRIIRLLAESTSGTAFNQGQKVGQAVGNSFFFILGCYLLYRGFFSRDPDDPDQETKKEKKI